jgi:hypothetical protein
MSPREGFGIVVRAVGLGLILHGAARAMEAAMVHGWGAQAWIHLILMIVLGVWMLSGAKQLVAWAYKSES